MSNSRKFTLFLMGFAVILVMALFLAKFLTDVQAGQDAKRWLANAQQDTGSTTTPDDVRQWLVDNGFDVMVWNPHQERGWIGYEHKDDEAIYYVVQGSRPLIQGGLLSDASWLDLRFRFSLDRNFQDVESGIRGYALPTNR
jgi:hypothetical protein